MYICAAQACLVPMEARCQTVVSALWVLRTISWSWAGQQILLTPEPPVQSPNELLYCCCCFLGGLFVFVGFFDCRIHYVDQADLEFREILLPLPQECWASNILFIDSLHLPQTWVVAHGPHPVLMRLRQKDLGEWEANPSSRAGIPR